MRFQSTNYLIHLLFLKNAVTERGVAVICSSSLKVNIFKRLLAVELPEYPYSKLSQWDSCTLIEEISAVCPFASPAFNIIASWYKSSCKQKTDDQWINVRLCLLCFILYRWSAHALSHSFVLITTDIQWYMSDFVFYVSAHLWFLYRQALVHSTCLHVLVDHIYCGSILPVLRSYLVFIWGWWNSRGLV